MPSAPIPDMAAYSANLDSSTINWEKHVFIRSDDDTPNGFVFPKTAAVHSNFLTTFMDLGDDQLIFPVQRMEDHILGLIAVYLNHFTGADDAPTPTELRKPFLPSTLDGYASEFEVEFSKRFLDTNLGNVIGLLNACNYLQLTPLLELAALSLAQRCKGKTPEEIKSMFDGQRVPVRPDARE